MAIRRYLVPFGLGVVAGSLLARAWDRWRDATRRRDEAKQLETDEAASPVRARLTVTAPGEYLFPERESGQLEGRGDTGICLSGGGNRALSAAMGQLRALTALGLMRRVGYLSCVSGGSWIGGPYTFYRSGAADDEAFLGPHLPDTERRRRTLADWGELSSASIGLCATRHLDRVLEGLKGQVPTEELWQNAIGEIYYRPFGLYGASARGRYMAESEEQVESILERNAETQPTWDRTRFLTPRPERPFLIVNGTLLWPDELLEHQNRVLVQFTPSYVGNPYALTIEDREPFGRSERRETGGGFIESFAFGSPGPVEPPDSLDPPGEAEIELPEPRRPFTIWRASGISSNAPGEFFARFLLLGRLNPMVDYWPCGLAGREPAAIYPFGDGGNLENYGIMALLQRKVRRIVVFVNTSTRLTAGGDVDTYLPPLFGRAHHDYRNNQVFHNGNGQLDSLVRELYERSVGGGLAMARRTYFTRANPWFGIERYRVEVLWVYNALVGDWLSELDPEVAAEVRRGAGERSGPLRDFPNYSTILQDGPAHFAELDPPQVNLLADMFGWAIQNQPEPFAEILG